MEAIYPLSPMQQGMLFHSLYAPEAGLYLEQLNWTLRGELDAEALRRAGARAMERHTILRTAFFWEGTDEPLQVVGERGALPMTEHDWRGLAHDEQERRLADFLREDRARGFDLARAPLMRLALIRREDDLHQLIWTHHHLLMDGWSASTLVGEVSAVYEAMRRGEKARLERPRPYGDYIAWLQRQDLRRAESYWRETLRGFTAPTPLGVDRAPAASAEGAEQQHDKKLATLSAEATAALAAVARRGKLTLNTLVQGSWALMLSRYSGEDDVVFGSVVSGRPADLPGVETMVGMFINTLPVRVATPPDAALPAWLGELQERQAEARQYEYSPLAQVQAWSEVPRDLPLFESVFVFENFPVHFSEGAQDSPVEIQDVWIVERANYPLTVVAVPGPELKLVAFYDRARFDDATIDRMLGHWRTLLEDVAARPEQTLREVRLLPDAERAEILSGWGAAEEDAAARDETRAALLHRMFEERAAANPDDVAVTFAGEAWTYGRLNERSNQIAHGLASLGVGRGRPVAVMLDSGPVQVAALFGALKAGCAFACLDQNYPPARLRQVLSELAPPVVIADASSLAAHETLLREFVGETRARLVSMDARGGESVAGGEVVRGAGWFESQPTTNPGIEVEPSALAYVVFTSGSTGQPKGIMQSHRSFAQFLDWQSNYFEMVAPKRVAQWASITYDASYCEIFGALCYGATLSMAAPATRFDPAALARWVRDERITLLQVVPSFCRQLLQALEADAQGARPLPTVERMLLAGEVVTEDLVRRWAKFSDAELFNLYGPSETVLATYYPLAEYEGGARSVPVGRAIAGRQILILDEAGRLCPVGVRGEIYVRSRFLTDGYWNRPEETRRAFVQNPLHDEYPDPAYRTGDLGRWLPDGNIEFFGRKDHQVKVRGMRVELDDIQSALERHEAVGECVVVAHEFGENDQRLVAYVVRDPNFADDEERAGGDGSLTSLEEQYIEQCQTVYDEIYSIDRAFSEQDSGINLRAWTSSYTNDALPEDEIIEAVDDTVGRLLSLRPRRVLELGCGTGLLLFRVAPHCESFCGTDISSSAVELLRRQLAARTPALGGVTIEQAAAHEADKVSGGPFDLVMMNLVTQHFPSVDYLRRVIRGAAGIVAPGGHVFVGGIRSLPLLETFQVAVQLEQAPAFLTKEQLRERVRERIAGEKDLIIDPAFFEALARELPNVGRVEVRPKGGRADNEITKFQYDVILHVGERRAEEAEVSWRDWPEGDAASLQTLRTLLQAESADAVGFARVPNARLRKERRAVELLAADGPPETAEGIRQALKELTETEGVEPQDLWELARGLPYEVELSWSRTDETGAFDVVFRRRQAGGRESSVARAAVASSSMSSDAGASAPERKAWADYANNPLQARYGSKLTPVLRGFAQERLPEHMVPSVFIFLDALPKTRTGKVDRKALPKPKSQRPETGQDYVAPRTELETLIAKVWQDVLKVDRVGVHDHFFNLGGHSLLATQVINRLREVCLVDLPLRGFFEAPTVAGLAERLAAARGDARAEAEKVSRLAERVRQFSPEEMRALLERKKSSRAAT
ncbi:MAG TPA: amino acid adenylation domain-containing protein [Pyrinomonadaceae bacterium]|nr:amino acid adenylation domain-containing protein [Pyrinomonadaceae bacterium]